MKTLHISIIVIACIVAASVIWYFTSYDPTPVTKENNFGISALVIHSPMSRDAPPNTVFCMNIILRSIQN